MDKVKRKFDKLSKSQKIIFISGITVILVGPVAGYIIYTRLQESKKTLTPKKLDNMYFSSVLNANNQQLEQIESTLFEDEPFQLKVKDEDESLQTEDTKFYYKHSKFFFSTNEKDAPQTIYFNGDTIDIKLNHGEAILKYTAPNLDFVTIVKQGDSDKLVSTIHPEFNSPEFSDFMRILYSKYLNYFKIV